MPNRIIKESICTSPTIAKLSAEAERLFYRLMVKCDDFGRFHGDDRVILGACFPMQIDQIASIRIHVLLHELEAAGLLFRYFAEDRVFIQVTSWDKHQNIRAKTSKYPQPTPENTIMPLAGDGRCDQIPADVPVSRISDLESRISSLDLKNISSPDGDAVSPRPKKKTGKVEYAPGFLGVYATYPRKVSKFEAFKAYQGIKEPRPTDDELIKAIGLYKKTLKGKKDRGEFCPDYCHLSVWINHRRWEDEPDGQGTGSLKKVFSQLCDCRPRPGVSVRENSAGQTTAMYCKGCGKMLERYE